MKTFLTLSLLTLSLLASAQQTTLRGIVAVFNSKFETGKTEYVANAQVEETFNRATPTTTAADGAFKLVLVGIKEKSGFDFKVEKSGYEVVNTDQLRAVAGQRDAVRIFIAPRGKIAENKRKYYNIGKTASEKALDQKIKAKQEEARALRADQTANRQQINEVEKEIADLYRRYETIDQNARELAERFSHVNLDDASELYQRAFRHFQNGSIDSALLVLDEVNWVARVDSILAEEARLFALKTVIDFNDSVLAHRRDSLAGAIQVKIQSHLGLREYREALRTGEWLLQLYAQDTTAALIESYRQAAWLSLLAQEYSLAKLYAQSGLEKDTSDPALQGYLAYTLCLQSNAHNIPYPLPTGFRGAFLRDMKSLEEAGLPVLDITALRKCFD